MGQVRHRRPLRAADLAGLHAEALKGSAAGEFESPSENIVWINIDGETGNARHEDTRQPVLEAYLKGSEPPDEGNAIPNAAGQPAPTQPAPNAAQARIRS